jgi:asparagine synthase (glutamine-hydrolysing)
MLQLLRNLFGPRTPAIIQAVQRDKLSYLDTVALLDLYRTVQHIERQGVEGAIIEAGCALGGSALVIASAKSLGRPFEVYDVFAQIPAPSERDGPDVHARYRVIESGQSIGIDGQEYYGYKTHLIDIITDTFKRYGMPLGSINTKLVQGLFQDTMSFDRPVALAHIDGDWYDSVMTCLTRIAPVLTVNGVIIIDDYESWSGCRAAVDDFFRKQRNNFSFTHASRLHIHRKC